MIWSLFDVISWSTGNVWRKMDFRITIGKEAVKHFSNLKSYLQKIIVIVRSPATDLVNFSFQQSNQSISAEVLYK